MQVLCFFFIQDSLDPFKLIMITLNLYKSCYDGDFFFINMGLL